MHNPWRPQPAPPGFGDGKIVPEYNASPISRVLYTWLDSLLRVGFTRPLQKEDLWQLPSPLLTESVTVEIERNFYTRCPLDKQPGALNDSAGEQSTEEEEKDVKVVPDARLNDSISNRGNDSKQADTAVTETLPEVSEDSPVTQETVSRADRTKDWSLLMALYITFRWQWWVSGLLKLASETLKTTTPLLNRRLLTWLTTSFVFYQAGPEAAALAGVEKPQGVGYGIGLAFALFVMQESTSLMTNYLMQTTMTIGVAVRSGIIGAIFRKALRLSGRARQSHNVGQVTTMISADSTRLDSGCHFVHNLWVSPIQIIIAIGLLIGTLGYSALVGLGVMIFAIPIQFIPLKIVYDQRQKMVAITDQRIRLITEVLQGIRLIKYYAWESFFSGKILEMRAKELHAVKNAAFALSSMIAFVNVLPVVATVLSFVTYALTGHDLNVATIFTSLQFFNVLHYALSILPFAFASSADAFVAVGRITAFLTAEELGELYTIDERSEFAIDVHGDFQWEAAKKSPVNSADAKDNIPSDAKLKKKEAKKDTEPILPTSAPIDPEKDEEKLSDSPFGLKNLSLQIPRGSFVAIVGRVGSGKSSLLQALFGEMRRTDGSCVFSSSAAYVPQSSWIMNATLRDNILFGRPADEEKLRDIIRACCLEKDLEMLPNGQFTEIGEKGINLSGGQKARVSLARAAYSGADIILMDDSLSAFDAHVGKAVLENCILSGPLSGKTRVLVTHALHVLHKTDYIYVMDKGTVAEQGTYESLMEDSILFSRVMEEYGTQEHRKTGDLSHIEETISEKPQSPGDDKEDGNSNEHLMQDEERLTGAVSSTVYKKYFKYAGGYTRLPIILLLLAGYQGASVANTLFLGFWTSQSIEGFTQADYMATYASLGAAVGVFAFACSFYICTTGITAGFAMFKASLAGILHSTISFFDTTPMGRVLSRLSKDQDTVDTEIAVIAFALLSIFSSVLGTAALVFYTFPLLGIIFVPLSIFYYVTAVFYRRTSVEVKRLDSLMRSALYGSYSETLTGLATVRAYRAQNRFIHTTDHALDMENRAYYITIAIQRWLSVRLDFLGNILVFGIALFAAGFRKTVDPGKIGVVLSYSLGITQILSELVSTYAQNEQNFNAVERILHYTELEAEGALTTSHDPAPSWPARGEVKFHSVEMAYREGLPLVLKGVSFGVHPGEKIGIVGRTGAGKSSLLQALFRFVNLHGGSISIDGVDIATIGLETLRSRIALVPQDSTLFLGTIRDNLDPQASRTDAELIEALCKAGLLPREGSSDIAAEAKFSLDAAVNDEGSNYSAGEKQLIALCRALIKNSRVIVLDEATSNVDSETDAKLQQTIQTEFASSTLLCIAHRLNTIVYYDRILVMDDGQVAEFDTPLNLYDNERSIFRSLCNEAALAREDIIRIRASVPTPQAHA